MQIKERPKTKSHIYFDFHKFLPWLFESGYWQINWFIDWIQPMRE